jgi:hypothetical protein
MARIRNAKATLDDANAVKAVWQMLPDFKLGAISLNDFTGVLDAADLLQKQYVTKDVELTGVRGNRDDKVRQLGELVTRFRSSIRGAYGPDSAVYEQAGGTRASARKAPTRKPTVAPADDSAVGPHA